ncbi:hypothetical protein LZ30DRAFT_29896 [Colletotrichum cereale]|nr:hypothetical protein LZ30DRAFT_29896 [Colletotrichum cereale]
MNEERPALRIELSKMETQGSFFSTPYAKACAELLCETHDVLFCLDGLSWPVSDGASQMLNAFAWLPMGLPETQDILERELARLSLREQTVALEKVFPWSSAFGTAVTAEWYVRGPLGSREAKGFLNNLSALDSAVNSTSLLWTRSGRTRDYCTVQFVTGTDTMETLFEQSKAFLSVVEALGGARPAVEVLVPKRRCETE